MHHHVILTLGRSGSNTLADLLNQNAAILNYGEVLGGWNKLRQAQRALRLCKEDDRAYLDALLHKKGVLRTANLVRSLGKAKGRKWSEIKALRRVAHVGFKEFATHFIELGITDYLKTRPDIKVIGLERTNAIDRMISVAFLDTTGVIALPSSEKRGEKPKLWIDPDRVLEQLDIIERESNELRRMLEVLPEDRVMRIRYEDLYSGPVQTLRTTRRAYAFLGVPDHMPSVRMRKILKGDPLDALANGAELREVIASSRFAHYMHDAPDQVAERVRRAQDQHARSLLDA